MTSINLIWLLGIIECYSPPLIAVDLSKHNWKGHVFFSLVLPLQLLINLPAAFEPGAGSREGQTRRPSGDGAQPQPNGMRCTELRTDVRSAVMPRVFQREERLGVPAEPHPPGREGVDYSCQPDALFHFEGFYHRCHWLLQLCVLLWRVLADRPHGVSECCCQPAVTAAPPPWLDVPMQPRLPNGYVQPIVGSVENL